MIQIGDKVVFNTKFHFVTNFLDYQRTSSEITQYLFQLEYEVVNVITELDTITIRYLEIALPEKYQDNFKL